MDGEELKRQLTITQLQLDLHWESGEKYIRSVPSALKSELNQPPNLGAWLFRSYLQNPEAKSDGDTPQKSDYYLTVGFGVRF